MHATQLSRNPLLPGRHRQAGPAWRRLR